MLVVRQCLWHCWGQFTEDFSVRSRRTQCLKQDTQCIVYNLQIQTSAWLDNSIYAYSEIEIVKPILTCSVRHQWAKYKTVAKTTLSAQSTRHDSLKDKHVLLSHMIWHSPTKKSVSFKQTWINNIFKFIKFGHLSASTSTPPWGLGAISWSVANLWLLTWTSGHFPTKKVSV